MSPITYAEAHGRVWLDAHGVRLLVVKYGEFYYTTCTTPDATRLTTLMMVVNLETCSIVGGHHLSSSLIPADWKEPLP